MKLTRRVTFSSGHRYWKSSLSEQENVQLFGRWASRFSHGHNYTLEVTISGVIDPESGMVINIKIIDGIIRRRVIAAFDGKSLNDEVAEFADLTPTTENLAIAIWRRLDKMPREAALVSLRLYETPSLFVDYFGGEVVLLTRGYEFSASHRLHSQVLSAEQNVELFGKCNNPSGHGHNYELEVTVSGTPDPQTGMAADIEEIDRIVHEQVVDRYDHKHLNEDIPELRGLNPTTEVLTRTIWQRLAGVLPAKLERITVRETARNIFEYAGEDE